MSEHDLLLYLRYAKGILKSLSSVSKVHIVQGNEACDLDSAMCAIVYAFYLHKTQSESSAPVVPLLNVVEADYVLHTEVTYALQDCGITQELLIFRDQVNLTDLHDNHQLVLTLVDHNAMSPEERSLEGAVCEVIDHHMQAKKFPPSVDVTLELVGSCCSLVAEKLLNDARFDLDPLAAHLLLGTILLDTACLVEGKEKDVSQAERLETLLPDHSREQTYKALLGARQQISGLSAFDVLRKDLKVISSDKLKITVSSVPCLIEVFLARDDAESAFEDFTHLHHADVVIVMAIDIDLATCGQIHRQVLVHSFSPLYRDQVIDALMATGPLLSLGRPISTPLKHLHAFEQDNSKSSRKKLLPVIERFLRDKQSPEKRTPTSSSETPPSVHTDAGHGQDLSVPEALKDTSSVSRDDATVSGDAGLGVVEGECRGQTGGDVCCPKTHNVASHPVLMSCSANEGQDAVTVRLSGNAVATMIASDMERLKSQECQRMIAADGATDGATDCATDGATDCALNVVAGRIAAEMKQMESAVNEVTTRSVTVAGNSVIAQKIAAKMQLQEDNRRPGESDSKHPLERAVAPSEIHKPCHRPGVLRSRGGDRTRGKKKLSVRHSDTDITTSGVRHGDTDMTASGVRHSDTDTRKTDSCGDQVAPEDTVHAAADRLVTAVVNSAIDLYLDPSTQEYVHPERAPGASEEEVGSASSVKEGVETNSAQPMDGLKARRPTDLESTPKKKIVPLAGELLHQEDIEVSVDSSSSSEIGLSIDGEKTPDDLTTPDIANDSVFGSLDWESDTACSPVEPIPEYTAQEEFDDERSWKTVQFGNKCYRIDMKVIEPYKKVLSHGGYYGDGFNAIVVLTACHLPDKRRRDYNYVMDNLFLYVLNTLDLLVVDDYMIVYFHGAAPSYKIPTVRWLKRCYDLIDRRLRKNLKQLVIVHPTLWLKTVALMSRPFISSKFLSKLKYVKNLEQLKDIVPMEYIHIPDEVKQYDENKSPSASSPT